MELTREQINTILHQRVDDQAIDAILAHDQAQRERIAQLEDWRENVTVALQREGGAFFADVPKHIKDMVAQLQTQAAALAEVEKERDAWKDAALDYPQKCIDLQQAEATIQRLEGERELWASNLPAVNLILDQNIEAINRQAKALKVVRDGLAIMGDTIVNCPPELYQRWLDDDVDMTFWQWYAQELLAGMQASQALAPAPGGQSGAITNEVIDSIGRNLNSRCENGCGTAAREMLIEALNAPGGHIVDANKMVEGTK